MDFSLAVLYHRIALRTQSQKSIHLHSRCRFGETALITPRLSVGLPRHPRISIKGPRVLYEKTHTVDLPAEARSEIQDTERGEEEEEEKEEQEGGRSLSVSCVCLALPLPSPELPLSLPLPLSATLCHGHSQQPQSGLVTASIHGFTVRQSPSSPSHQPARQLFPTITYPPTLLYLYTG